MPKVILSLLLLMGTLGAEAQEKSPGLVINELMQSNIDCVMDDRNEFPDSWVELYNNSGETVALKDYRLGIGTKSDEAYLLPPVSVQTKGHILVYATGRRQASIPLSVWSLVKAVRFIFSRVKRLWTAFPRR